MKHWLIIVCLLCSSWAVQAQERSLQIETDREDILIGEQVQMTLRLVTASADTAQLPLIGDTLRKEVEVIDRSKVDTTFEGPQLESRVLTQRFTLTSFDSGYFVVEPLEALVNGDTILSNPFLVAVQTIEVDTAKGPVDIKGIAEVPFAWDEWLQENWHWFALGLAVLVGILLLAKYLTREKPEAPSIKVAPSRPPHEVALERLNELSEQEWWQKGKYKTYYSELTDILRTYIEDRFAIPALEQTSDELVRAMAHQSTFDNEARTAIKNLLFLADLVKFAKEKPLGQENQQHFDTVKRFIEETKPVEPTAQDASETPDEHG